MNDFSVDTSSTDKLGYGYKTGDIVKYQNKNIYTIKANFSINSSRLSVTDISVKRIMASDISDLEENFIIANFDNGIDDIILNTEEQTYSNGIGVKSINVLSTLQSFGAELALTNKDPFNPTVVNAGRNYVIGQIITKHFATKIKLGVNSLLPTLATTENTNGENVVGEWLDNNNLNVTESGKNYRVNDIITYPFSDTDSSQIEINTNLNTNLSSSRIILILKINSEASSNIFISGLADVISSGTHNNTIFKFKELFNYSVELNNITNSQYHTITMYELDKLDSSHPGSGSLNGPEAAIVERGLAILFMV